jgi:hypothetical protein
MARWGPPKSMKTRRQVVMKSVTSAASSTERLVSAEVTLPLHYCRGSELQTGPLEQVALGTELTSPLERLLHPGRRGVNQPA